MTRFWDGRTDRRTDGRSDCTPRPAFAFGDADKNDHVQYGISIIFLLEVMTNVNFFFNGKVLLLEKTRVKYINVIYKVKIKSNSKLKVTRSKLLKCMESSCLREISKLYRIHCSKVICKKLCAMFD